MMASEEVKNKTEPLIHPHPIPVAINPKSNILQHHHALLITVTNTFSQLLFKCLPAFIAYIMIDYSFSYSFIIMALSIGSLFCAFSFILNPLMLHCRSNIIFCIFSLLMALSCFILWWYRHSKFWFIIAVIILSLVENVCYGCSNAFISTFTSDSTRSQRYLTALNSAWTIATFLFFGVGYLMKMGSIWLFLEVMFVAFIMIAILNLIFLPSLSANEYNLSNSNRQTISIRNDLSVLFGIKALRFIIIGIILLFINWGYFYSSFDVWLKDIFNLDQAQFGWMAGLAEGIGNLCGILFIAYFAKDSSDKQNGKYKLSLQAIMLWTGIGGCASMMLIYIINFVGWYNESFLFVLIGIYFFNFETCTVAALILIVNIVPPLQQARASSIIGIVQSFTVFTAQMTVAPLYSEFGGMEFESFCLMIMLFIMVLNLIYLNNIMKTKLMLNQELLPINVHQNDIAQYT